jgi:hypothetical protein
MRPGPVTGADITPWGEAVIVLLLHHLDLKRDF